MKQPAIALALSAFILVSTNGCRSRQKPPAAPGPAQPEAAPPSTMPADSLAEAERVRREAEAAAQRDVRGIEAPVYFEFDASDLTAAARATLDEKAAILSRNPAVRLLILGHTDDRGSDEYNLALGQRRAAAARRYLADSGIDSGRLEISSMGEETPACEDATESCWARNRRAEFTITAGRPGLAPTR